MARSTSKCPCVEDDPGIDVQPVVHFHPGRSLRVDHAFLGPAALVEIGDALAPRLGAHVALAVQVEPAHVRCQKHVVELLQRAVDRQRLGLESVEPGRRSDARSASASARACSSTRPPRAVLINTEPGFILRQRAGVDQIGGLRRAGQVQADDVGPVAEQFVERYQPHAVLLWRTAGSGTDRRRSRSGPARRCGARRPGPCARQADQPQVRPASRGNAFRFQTPVRTSRSRPGNPRNTPNNKASVCSATEWWLVPVAIVTSVLRTPLAAGTSMASSPTPIRAMARSPALASTSRIVDFAPRQHGRQRRPMPRRAVGVAGFRIRKWRAWGKSLRNQRQL